MPDRVRQLWSRSRLYRVALTAAAVYAVLRLGVHVVYLSGALTPTGYEEYTVPIDLQLYVDAARAIISQQDLYPTATTIEVYQYPPAFALAFTPFLLLSPIMLVSVHSVLHIGAYLALYVSWDRILARLDLTRGRATLAMTLPVWLVFASFWSDLGFLNTYILLALLGTLAIEAVIEERLGRSILWLAIIIQIKPHWAFVLFLPLLLGRYRFFVKLAALTAVVSAAVVLATSLMVGPAYGWQQHVGYARFLADLRGSFPWRGPEDRFLGYSHSITQIVTFLFGVSNETLRAALGVKIALLIPLVVTTARQLARPVRRPGREVPLVALDWALALYAAVFIWLDMVWEFSLGIAVFTYLLATSDGRPVRALVWLVFMPYALLDFWRLFSIAVFGMDIIAPGVYILTDPSVYVPLIMIVILSFYGVLLVRLWRAQNILSLARTSKPAEICPST